MTRKRQQPEEAVPEDLQEPVSEEVLPILPQVPPPVRYVAVGSLVYFIPYEVRIKPGEEILPEVLDAIRDTEVFQSHLASGHVEIQ